MPDFAIAAAQVASVRGDIGRNVAAHAAAIKAAAGRGVAVLVFPELSLTGYEPDLAAELALAPTDVRLAPLQSLARQHGIAVLAGAPLRADSPLPNLGAVLFVADGDVRSYAKMHLGAGERAHFAPGVAPLAFPAGGQVVGVAICADASQPSHPEGYGDVGATIYAVGVCLNAEWYATDLPRLAGHAANYRQLVVMANHADSAGTYLSVGKSAVWAPNGALLAQAGGTEPCLVIASGGPGAWRGEVVRLESQ